LKLAIVVSSLVRRSARNSGLFPTIPPFAARNWRTKRDRSSPTLMRCGFQHSEFPRSKRRDYIRLRPE